MSPVKHPVSGDTLVFTLQDEMQRVRSELSSVPSRIARTLVKEGPITVTLVGVNAGGELHEHRAAGPITVQVLEGDIDFHTQGATKALSKGTLFALGAGIPHSVSSRDGGFFLLTVTNTSGAQKAH